MHRHGVPDSLRTVSNQLRTITEDHLRVRRLRRVGVVLGECNTMNTGPLLDLLSQVGVKYEVVSGAVPGLHLRVRAGPGRVHALDLRHPLLLSLPDVAICASGVRTDGRCARRSGQTTCSHARVGGPSGEQVRVRGCKDVGHHAAGRGSGYEELGRVGAVLLDRILDHVGEALGVAAAFVGERLGGCNVPAVEVLGSAWEDGDEAVLFGQGVVFGLLGVSGTIASATMKLSESAAMLHIIGG